MLAIVMKIRMTWLPPENNSINSLHEVVMICFKDRIPSNPFFAMNSPRIFSERESLLNSLFDLRLTPPLSFFTLVSFLASAKKEEDAWASSFFAITQFCVGEREPLSRWSCQAHMQRLWYISQARNRERGRLSVSRHENPNLWTAELGRLGPSPTVFLLAVRQGSQKLIRSIRDGYWQGSIFPRNFPLFFFSFIRCGSRKKSLISATQTH